MSRFRGLMLRTLVLLCIAGIAWADLWLVEDRLALDATAWSGAHLWRAEQAGLTQNKSAFERVEAIAGLTGHLGSVVSVRTSGDVGYLQPQDLYLDLHWSNGWGLRAGQFLLPLGMDAATEPDSQVLPGNALMVGYAKPNGLRDIGVLGGFETNRLSAAAGVVNGSGANADDNNGSKDLCGRVAVRPSSVLDAILAVRIYYGWPDASDSIWRSMAAEARLRKGPLELQAEFQNHYGPESRNNAGYAQASWTVRQLQPVGRLDLTQAQGRLADWMMTAGLNARPISDQSVVMLGCSYRRNYQGNWSFLALFLRLRATI